MTTKSEEIKEEIEEYVSESILGVVRRSPPLLLLATLIAYITIMPILDSTWVKTIGMLVIIIACLGVATRNRRDLIVSIGIAIPASVLLILDNFRLSHTFELVGYGLALFLFMHIIRLMLKQIFATRVVTIDTIGLALCTYVLLGMLWVIFYVPVEYADPSAFAFSNPRDGDEPISQMIYFSYVTLTTLGYGDVAPVSPVAQSLAITEALTGTLFLAVLISRLVGTISVGKRNKSPKD